MKIAKERNKENHFEGTESNSNDSLLAQSNEMSYIKKRQQIRMTNKQRRQNDPNQFKERKKKKEIA